MVGHMYSMLRFAGAVLLAVFVVCGSARAFEIQIVTSKAGVSAWLVQSSHAPIVTLKFSMVGGASLDEPGKEGAAVVMADMMSEGAGELDSEAFQLALAQLSSGLSLRASADFLSGTVYCLKENCAKTFELMRLALTSPRFEEKDFQRVLQQSLQGLQRTETDQNTIAYETWSAIAYAGHHYGRRSAGTRQSVGELTTSDLRRAHERQMSKRMLSVSVVGDIDKASLGDALDMIFGGLPDKDVGPLPVKREVAQGAVTKIIDYDAPQSVVQFGGPGMLEDTPDRIAAYVLGELLGGGAGFARLNQALREKSGLTYGISFGHSAARYAADMSGGFSTAKGTANQALAALDKELTVMMQAGPSADELARMKSYLRGSFVLRLTDNDSIADMLLGALRDGRGVDFIERRKARIEAVTVEDVKRVAGKLLQKEKRIVVVVGRPE